MLECGELQIQRTNWVEVIGKRGFILSHVHILKRLGILRDRIGNMSFVGDMDLVVHMNVQILRSDVIAMSGKGEARSASFIFRFQLVMQHEERSLLVASML